MQAKEKELREAIYAIDNKISEKWCDIDRLVAIKRDLIKELVQYYREKYNLSGRIRK